jgi:metal-responsive CopG/Arc/MetJ family transcriptional regulator
MKTAISIPDSTYERISRALLRLKMSRSRFFAEAAESYLRRVEGDDVTARINAFVVEHGSAGLDPIIRQHGQRHFQHVEW